MDGVTGVAGPGSGSCLLPVLGRRRRWLPLGVRDTRNRPAAPLCQATGSCLSDLSHPSVWSCRVEEALGHRVVSPTGAGPFPPLQADPGLLESLAA